MLKGCYYEDRLLLDNCLEDTGIKDLRRRSDGSIKRDAERGASLGLLIKSLFIRWISVGFVSTTITIATCWEGLMQLRVSRSSFQTWNCLDHLEMYVRTFIVFFKAIHFNHKYNHRSAQIFCCSKTQWWMCFVKWPVPSSEMCYMKSLGKGQRPLGAILRPHKRPPTKPLGSLAFFFCFVLRWWTKDCVFVWRQRPSPSAHLNLTLIRIPSSAPHRLTPQSGAHLWLSGEISCPVPFPLGGNRRTYLLGVCS